MAMPRIDPYTLIKTLGPLLSPKGGIRSSEEVTRIVQIMPKFSRKMVSKCVYIQILKATTSELLEKFLVEKGWDLLNMWLSEAVLSENWAQSKELIKLLSECPATTRSIKDNLALKLVKQVTRDVGVDEYKKLKLCCILMEQHNTLLEQHNALLEQQKSKPQISDSELEQLKLKAENNDSIIEQLKSKIECPVCYEIPKRIPIPVCPNGHIVCQSCKQDDCPMCRESMEDGKSLVAATVVQNLLHDCDYVVYGCGVIQVKHADLVQHLNVCPYRFHNNGWTHLSEAAGIRLRGNFVDLGIKVTPVTSFYDYENARCHCLACQNRNHCTFCEKRNHLNFDHRKKVMWPPNAIEYDGTIFFLYVIADKYGSGIWRFIVEWGDDRMTGMDRVGAREKYRVGIVVFKPRYHGGCRRHFHQHSIVGKLDDKDQLILTLDNSLMQGLFLDDKFAVTVEICQSDEVTNENNFDFRQVRYCCDVTRRRGRFMPF